MKLNTLIKHLENKYPTFDFSIYYHNDPNCLQINILTEGFKYRIELIYHFKNPDTDIICLSYPDQLIYNEHEEIKHFINNLLKLERLYA